MKQLRLISKIKKNLSSSFSLFNTTTVFYSCYSGNIISLPTYSSSFIKICKFSYFFSKSLIFLSQVLNIDMSENRFAFDIITTESLSYTSIKKQCMFDQMKSTLTTYQFLISLSSVILSKLVTINSLSTVALISRSRSIKSFNLAVSLSI